MHCAFCFAMIRRSRRPLLSMNLISLRSTMQARALPLRWFFFQRALSTPTQGAVRRPCSVHLSSDGVSLKLIFNMLFSFKSSVLLLKYDCARMAQADGPPVGEVSQRRCLGPIMPSGPLRPRNTRIATKAANKSAMTTCPCTIPTQTRPRCGDLGRCVPNRRDDSSLFQEPEVMSCSVATFRVTFFCHGKFVLSPHRPTDPCARPSAP